MPRSVTSPSGLPPSDAGAPWWTQGWVGGLLVSAVVGVVFTTGVEIVVPLLDPPLPAGASSPGRDDVAPARTFPRSASSGPRSSDPPSEVPSDPPPATPSEVASDEPSAQPAGTPDPTAPAAPASAKRARTIAEIRQAQRAVRLRRERRAARELAVLARQTLATWGPVSGTWVAPLASYRLSAHYGETGPRWRTIHTGQDLAAPTGTPVQVVTAGFVTFAGWDGPYGNKVEVTHPDGTVTWYAHLSRLDVAATDQVRTGQVIGLVGSTGNSTGPHLHMEVRPGGGDPVDPAEVLREHGVGL